MSENSRKNLNSLKLFTKFGQGTFVTTEGHKSLLTLILSVNYDFSLLVTSPSSFKAHMWWDLCIVYDFSLLITSPSSFKAHMW